MAISLSKGGNLSLTKAAPGIQRLHIGLGWNARATEGSPFDLDASAFLVGADGRIRGDKDFIFYNQPASAEGAVVYKGDNRTGAGEGDDEVIEVQLGSVPADVAKVVIGVSIHEADVRRQNFGMVSNAFIRCVNLDGGAEVARYDLTEDASIETAMVFGEIYRHGEEWKFRAVGQGFQGGLVQMAGTFGLNF
jgi:tellurium resistance protein TerD